MNVGRRVDYAVRALSYLAGQPIGAIVSRADIEKSQDIPSFYLSKIMKDLVAGGLVQSHIGSKGGFTLAKKAGGDHHQRYLRNGRATVGVDGVSRTGRELLFVLRGLHRRNRFGKRRSRCLANFLAGVTIADIADRQGMKGRMIKAPVQRAG